jgi:hypothetical protein
MKTVGEVVKTLYDIILNDYNSRELKVKCWVEICRYVYIDELEWRKMTTLSQK